METQDVTTFVNILLIIISFAVLDGFWLFMRKDFYSNEIQRVQGSKMQIRMGGVIMSYILMVLVVAVFSVPRVNDKNKFHDSLLYGGLLGLVIYGIYNFVNYATLSGYSLTYVVTDTLWGIFLMFITTYIVVRVKSS